MTVVEVIYHREGDSWWADAPNLEGFVAVGESLHEVRQLVREGVPYYLEDDSVEYEEVQEAGTLVVEVRFADAPSRPQWQGGLTTGSTETRPEAVVGRMTTDFNVPA